MERRKENNEYRKKIGTVKRKKTWLKKRKESKNE